MLNIRDIDHVVLRVKDIEAMSRFYCDVLGAKYVAYRPEFGMTHLCAGASMIDLVAVDGPLGRPGGAPAGKEAATWTTCACASSPSTRTRSSPTSSGTASPSATSALASAPRATAFPSTSPIRKATPSSSRALPTDRAAAAPFRETWSGSRATRGKVRRRAGWR